MISFSFVGNKEVLKKIIISAENILQFVLLFIFCDVLKNNFVQFVNNLSVQSAVSREFSEKFLF